LKIKRHSKSDLKRYLEKKGFQVLSALTIEDGETLFEQNKDVALIIMDACVPGNIPNTMALTQQIKQGFNGPMLATSSEAPFRKLLIKAGCTHECEKHKIIDSVLEILKP